MSEPLDRSNIEEAVARLERLDPRAAAALHAAFDEIAPNFADTAIAFAFGDIYTRPGLDPRAREMVTMGALAAIGDCRLQLQSHMRAALNVGCKRTEIVEAMVQLAVYVGFPRAINGLTAAIEVFESMDRHENNREELEM